MRQATQEITLEDLERLAAAMAQAIPALECPECFEATLSYRCVERSATMFREEWEWACLAAVLVRHHRSRRPFPPGAADAIG